MAQWSKDTPDADLITAQKEDSIIGKLYEHIEDPVSFPVTESDYAGKEDLRVLMKFSKMFQIQDGLLVRKALSGSNQWVVPTSF